VRRFTCCLLLAALPCLVLHLARPEKGLFDPDPRHPANRLSRHLSTRTTQEGESYDQESLDPVFLSSAKFLTEGASHREALVALDDFLQHQTKQPMKDPLQRAIEVPGTQLHQGHGCGAEGKTPPAFSPSVPDELQFSDALGLDGREEAYAKTLHRGDLADRLAAMPRRC